MDDTESWVMGCVFAFFVLLVVSIAVAGCADAQVRREAVQHGHAEWVVVGDDGNTKFSWLPPVAGTENKE